MNEREQAGEFWGTERTEEDRAYHWINHPVTRAHINQRISGNPDQGSLARWREHFISGKLDRALSLGCGFGAFERLLVEQDIVEHVLGTDVSEGAIRSAREAANAARLSDRVHYKVTDLNDFDFGRGVYDCIFGISAVHHIFDLENTFKRCRDALKPGGLLFLEEYIGSSRFQVSESTLEVMNVLIEILPMRLRRFMPPAVLETRDRFYQIPISWFEENDPSEAVRSAEIVSTLKLYFDIIDFRPFGGAMLHLFLSGIAGNFRMDREDDVAFLKLLAVFEDALEKHGAFGSDFAAIVARPKR